MYGAKFPGYIRAECIYSGGTQKKMARQTEQRSFFFVFFLLFRFLALFDFYP